MIARPCVLPLKELAADVAGALSKHENGRAGRCRFKVRYKRFYNANPAVAP